VVTEFSTLMKSYGVTTAESDKWGGDWVIQAFQKQGIKVFPSAKPKSDLYRELLPMLNAHRCMLLDNPRLIQQLCGLERRTARSGKDSIDHAPMAHDDVANAAAGALLLVSVTKPKPNWAALTVAVKRRWPDEGMGQTFK
jgi:phage terminase large subunit-like protein